MASTSLELKHHQIVAAMQAWSAEHTSHFDRNLSRDRVLGVAAESCCDGVLSLGANIG